MKTTLLAALISAHTVAGAFAYLLLIELVFGYDMNPFAPTWHWALQFEHGELQLEHNVHMIGVALAAVPIAFEVAFLRVPKAQFVLAAIGLLAAYPYLATPQLPYAEEQSWLLRYSVELEALRIFVAPSLLYWILRPAVQRLRREPKNAT
jgi:hypothetical protein